MGDVHARAVRRAGGVVQAIAGSTAASSLEAARRHFAVRPARDGWDVATADDVDVVHICTPNSTHAEFAIAALEAGKHVVCEKPLAVTVHEAESMATAAAHARTVASVPFVYRFFASARHARVLARSGELGRVHLIHGSYLQDWLSHPASDNWRTDATRGGPSRTFADIGVHWCDLAEFVAGQRITRLHARTAIAHAERSGRPVTTEDTAVLMFETDAGATGSVVLSQVSPGRKNRLWLSVDGIDGAAAFDQENPDSLWVGARDANRILMRGSADPADVAAYSKLPPGHPQGYQDAFDAFIEDHYRAIVGHEVDGLPTFADGLRAARLTEAVLESAASEAWVDVPASG
ncbi:Gfo/Idh/MocA family oxidoreductase [Demequina sp. SYSU T00039-1]|nr:Gfo/Idh/MocA family oxidoreductase [Demequina sp. SYSU T00039-1]MDN4477932.1 Gfo/Idh/MocA family oxidoreductase [Demequina sp. SYSU T00039-1]